jgi:hypothetical protein
VKEAGGEKTVRILQRRPATNDQRTRSEEGVKEKVTKRGMMSDRGAQLMDRGKNNSMWIGSPELHIFIARFTCQTGDRIMPWAMGMCVSLARQGVCIFSHGFCPCQGTEAKAKKGPRDRSERRHTGAASSELQGKQVPTIFQESKTGVVEVETMGAAENWRGRGTMSLARSWGRQAGSLPRA